MSRHYLDHASTTPPRPEAVAALLDTLAGPVGDPSRVHHEGREARAALEEHREAVAALLACRPREVVFTGGATESINAAAWGVSRDRPGAILCAGVEHSAVRDASARAAALVEVEVDRTGQIHPEAVREAGERAIRDHGRVALVQCQWANHEVGTIQPVAEVAAVAHEIGALVHVDAAAAVGHTTVPAGELGADLVSVSSHKLGGPAGAGVLVVRRGLRLAPLLVGGEQERARRAGLENLAAVAGLAAVAARLADPDTLAGEVDAARRHTEAVAELVRSIEGTEIYGPEPAANRVSHIVCFGVTGVEAEAVVIGLDQAGIAVHSGSACSSESLEPSPVLAAMGVDADRSIRVSVGWSTTDSDVGALGQALPGVVARLRSLRR